MKKLLSALLMLIALNTTLAQSNDPGENRFPVRGFHLDLRNQVMTMDALKKFALKLREAGMNTLVMEWEGTYPYEKHPLIPNRYAYTKEEVVSFIKYCNSLGIDVIPLQQSFGHVEYILRNERYKSLREDQKDFSQVCPLELRETVPYLPIYIQNWLLPIPQNISILVAMKPICLAMMKNAGLKLRRKGNRNCIQII